jgi:hypothetical protein
VTRKRLHELLARQTPRIRRRYLAAMERVRSRYTLARLEDALESGSISSVLDEVERSAALFAAQTEAVSVLVANEVAAQLSKQLDKLVTFDGYNARAVTMLASNRARMVSHVSDETRTIITDVLMEGTGDGLNPRKQAIGIRDSIGLTPDQARWVRSYRTRLQNLDSAALGMDLRDARFDGTVKTAIAEQKPLPAKAIDRMVERYYRRALKYRSEVIARTEGLAAVHEGMDLTYHQAVDDGTLPADRIVCKWHSGGPRSRHWHASMNGQRKPWGVAFVSGLGNLLRHPGDRNAPVKEIANCVCGRSVKVYPDAESARAALAAAS